MSTEQRPSVKPSGCRCGHPVLAHVVEDLPHYCVAKDCACLDYQRADSDPSENQTGSSSAASSVTLPEVVHDTLSDFKPQGDSVRGWYQE